MVFHRCPLPLDLLFAYISWLFVGDRSLNTRRTRLLATAINGSHSLTRHGVESNRWRRRRRPYFLTRSLQLPVHAHSRYLARQLTYARTWWSDLAASPTRSVARRANTSAAAAASRHLSDKWRVWIPLKKEAWSFPLDGAGLQSVAYCNDEVSRPICPLERGQFLNSRIQAWQLRKDQAQAETYRTFVCDRNLLRVRRTVKKDDRMCFYIILSYATYNDRHAADMARQPIV